VQLDQKVLGTADFDASLEPAGQKTSLTDGRLAVTLKSKETVVVALRRR
jgi:hypothetical protein